MVYIVRLDERPVDEVVRELYGTAMLCLATWRAAHCVFPRLTLVHGRTVLSGVAIARLEVGYGLIGKRCGLWKVMSRAGALEVFGSSVREELTGSRRLDDGKSFRIDFIGIKYVDG